MPVFTHPFASLQAVLKAAPRRCSSPWFVLVAIPPGGDGSTLRIARACCVSDVLATCGQGTLQSWKPFWSHGPIALTGPLRYVTSTKAQRFLEGTKASLFPSEPLTSSRTACSAAKGELQADQPRRWILLKSVIGSVTNTWDNKAVKVRKTLTFPVMREWGSWGRTASVGWRTAQFLQQHLTAWTLLSKCH